MNDSCIGQPFPTIPAPSQPAGRPPTATTTATATATSTVAGRGTVHPELSGAEPPLRGLPPIMRLLRSLLWLWLGLCPGLQTNPASAEESPFAVRPAADRLDITWNGEPVAEYVFRDPRILRPHFANLHAPGGVRVTRNHPPVAGVDPTDHDTMHPGVWLAFGDLNGQDFWRNKARIEHLRFLEPPRTDAHELVFSAENRLLGTNGSTLGTQLSRFAIRALPHGFLLVWQADFRPAAEPLVFGDQEEMGLGVRVATPITEKNGGTIVASTGAKSARTTWGQSFAWCDDSGEWAGRRVGVTLMPDPENFRPGWFHNRDYGLMVANPFGRNAMNQGEPSRVTVAPGERLRLRFGVYLHATAPPVDADIAEVYRRFVATRTVDARD